MTVRDRINLAADRLTATERKLSASLLSDYPFAGLESIQEMAEKVAVSSPSISRFVNKLGFSGYQEFQRHLIAELKESQRSPVDLYGDRSGLEGAHLQDFANRAIRLVRGTVLSVTDPQCQRVCDLLADPKRRIFVLGGRVSDLVAQHLSRHLRRMRGDVRHLEADPETWPDDLLSMRARDVLFLVDFRRYQKSLSDLAERATEQRRATLIVLTDKWMSPATQRASETLAVPVDSGTIWDSYAGAFTLTEAILTRIAEQGWSGPRRRIEAWDALLTTPKEDLHGP